MKKIAFIVLLFFVKICLGHNTGNVEGLVYDSISKTPLTGVNIYIKNSIIGTSSDINGVFKLRNIQIGSYELVISYLGYKTKTEKIQITEDNTTKLEINLTINSEIFSEVSIESYKPMNSASSQVLRKIDLEIKPNRTAQDMLMLTPGLIIAQHAGGGKAEQIYIRGFDCDHGTDIAINVDGMPVNMVSHGHGQGYADLHFLLPEVVDEINVEKGTYNVVNGNFSTAGAISFETKDILENNIIKIEGGDFNTKKLTLLYQPENGGNEQNVYFGAQYSATDGPFESPQGFNRLNIFGKYFIQLNNNSKLSLSLGSFSSAWNASGQIPTRAVENNIIDRFGFLDDKEGGTTGRQNINLEYTFKSADGGLFKINSYLSNYNFKLFSNFTFNLIDSVNGDMIEQIDTRIINGINAYYCKSDKTFGFNSMTKLGGGYRNDNIKLELWHSPERLRMNEMVISDILERNLYVFASREIFFGKRLKVKPGIRLDYFTFDVNDRTDSAKSGNIPHASGYSQALLPLPKLNISYKTSNFSEFFINGGLGFHSNDARSIVLAERLKSLNSELQKKGFNETEIDSVMAIYNFDRSQLNTRSLPIAYGGEIGYLMNFKNKIHLGISLFTLYLDKEIVYVGDGGTNELSDPTLRFGGEFESKIMIKKWLWFDADLCYSYGKIMGLPEGENYIPLAPRITSSGGINAKFYKNIDFAIRYRFVDDRPGNEDNTVIALGHKLLSSGLSYSYNEFKFFMTVENIFNIDWNEAQFDTETIIKGETESISEICYTPGNPRNFQFGITYKF